MSKSKQKALIVKPGWPSGAETFGLEVTEGNLPRVKRRCMGKTTPVYIAMILTPGTCEAIPEMIGFCPIFPAAPPAEAYAGGIPQCRGAVLEAKPTKMTAEGRQAKRRLKALTGIS